MAEHSKNPEKGAQGREKDADRSKKKENRKAKKRVHEWEIMLQTEEQDENV